MKRGLKVVLVVALVAALAAALAFLPLSHWLPVFVAWVRGQGFLGALVFAIVYVAATVFMLPGSLLTLGAGFVYGVGWGTLLISPVSVAAATAAFVVGRFFARGFVARKIANRPRFTALDEALGDGGLKMVILLRLSPVLPFNLLNYALGVTRVRLPSYVLGSFIGMLPGTVLFVYLGSLVTHAGELLAPSQPRGGQSAKTTFYWVGLAATVAVTVLITRAAKRAMNRRLGQVSP